MLETAGFIMGIVKRYGCRHVTPLVYRAVTGIGNEQKRQLYCTMALCIIIGIAAAFLGFI
jgi:hypothetical protein